MVMFMNRPKWLRYRKFNKCNSGFSLIELLVVLAIAGMLLTIVPPMFSGGVSSAELKGAARNLAAGLRSARSQAISRHKEVVLQVNVEKRSFIISEQKREFALPKKLVIKLTVADSEQIEDDLGGIRFFPDGSSSGGRVEVSVDKIKYQVDVNWLTGEVVIE